MGFQIDQSGKIENTNKDTILCLANGSWDAVIVKAKTKRQIQEIFRRNGQIRNYVLFTFSIILAALLNNLKLIPDIHFGFVGKSSPAHDKATKIAHNKLKAKYEISAKEILRALKKTEVGKQLKDT